MTQNNLIWKNRYWQKQANDWIFHVRLDRCRWYRSMTSLVLFNDIGDEINVYQDHFIEDLMKIQRKEQELGIIFMLKILCV